MGRIEQQIVFVAGDVIDPDPFEIVERRAEADRIGDVAGAIF